MSEPMSDERLAEIRERADALTRAIDAEFAKEWDAPYAHSTHYYIGAAVAITRKVPTLLAEVERLRAVEQRVRSARQEWARDASQARALVNKADAAKHVAGMFAENARAHTYDEVGRAIDAALEGTS